MTDWKNLLCHVNHAGTTSGPYTVEHLAGLLRRYEIKADWVWIEGWARWIEPAEFLRHVDTKFKEDRARPTSQTKPPPLPTSTTKEPKISISRYVQEETPAPVSAEIEDHNDPALDNSLKRFLRWGPAWVCLSLPIRLLSGLLYVGSWCGIIGTFGLALVIPITPACWIYWGSRGEAGALQRAGGFTDINSNDLVWAIFNRRLFRFCEFIAAIAPCILLAQTFIVPLIGIPWLLWAYVQIGRVHGPMHRRRYVEQYFRLDKAGRRAYFQRNTCLLNVPWGARASRVVEKTGDSVRTTRSSQQIAAPRDGMRCPYCGASYATLAGMSGFVNPDAVLNRSLRRRFVCPSCRDEGCFECCARMSDHSIRCRSCETRMKEA